MPAPSLGPRKLLLEAGPGMIEGSEVSAPTSAEICLEVAVCGFVYVFGSGLSVAGRCSART